MKRIERWRRMCWREVGVREQSLGIGRALGFLRTSLTTKGRRISTSRIPQSPSHSTYKKVSLNPVNRPIIMRVFTQEGRTMQ
jgi:hypothetical protein